MFTHINNLTVDNNRQLHRVLLHEITSAYRRTGRERVY